MFTGIAVENIQELDFISRNTLLWQHVSLLYHQFVEATGGICHDIYSFYDPDKAVLLPLKKKFQKHQPYLC